MSIDEASRDRAIAVLLDISEDDTLAPMDRGQAADIVLMDIREHRSLNDEASEQREHMNAQIERMESAYIELRQAMDALPTGTA